MRRRKCLKHEREGEYEKGAKTHMEEAATERRMSLSNQTLSPSTLTQMTNSQRHSIGETLSPSQMPRLQSQERGDTLSPSMVLRLQQQSKSQTSETLSPSIFRASTVVNVTRTQEEERTTVRTSSDSQVGNKRKVHTSILEKRTPPRRRQSMGPNTSSDSVSTPPQASRTTDADLQSSMPVALLSPPSLSQPLRSCLASRSLATKDPDTPSKRVNFGPPKHAEFHPGSPSVSMTPLRSKIPRSRHASTVSKSPEHLSSEKEEKQDKEKENKEANRAKHDALFSSPTAPTGRRSIHGLPSLIGEDHPAKKQRRTTLGATGTSSASPFQPTRRTSYDTRRSTMSSPSRSPSSLPFSLSMQNRQPYADSSDASEGEDMDITGEHTNHSVRSSLNRVSIGDTPFPDVDKEDHTVDLPRDVSGLLAAAVHEQEAAVQQETPAGTVSADENALEVRPSFTVSDLLSYATLTNRSKPMYVPNDFADLQSKADFISLTSAQQLRVAALNVACRHIVQEHASKLQKAVASLEKVTPQLLTEQVSPLFTKDALDVSRHQQLQKLSEIEAAKAKSQWLEQRIQMEEQLLSSLDEQIDVLRQDKTQLQQKLSSAVSSREQKLAAVKELLAKEQQTAQLLDAIEEQRAIRKDLSATVEALQKDVSGLSLQASVLERKVAALEDEASANQPPTEEEVTQRRKKVLEAEEMYCLLQQFTIWRVAGATSHQIKLNATREDPFFTSKVLTVIDFADETQPEHLQGTYSLDVSSTLTGKDVELDLASAVGTDVVRLVAHKLLDPSYFSRIWALEGLHSDKEHLKRLLVHLEHYVHKTFRLLKELRSLSASFSLRFDDDKSKVFIHFFCPGESRQEEDTKFSVGVPVGLDAANGHVDVHVTSGAFSEYDVRNEVFQVRRTEDKYLSNVCDRLRKAFIRPQKTQD